MLQKIPLVTAFLDVVYVQEYSQSVLSAVFAAADRYRDQCQSIAEDERCKLLQAMTSWLADSVIFFDGALVGLQAAHRMDLAQKTQHGSLKNLASVIHKTCRRVKQTATRMSCGRL